MKARVDFKRCYRSFVFSLLVFFAFCFILSSCGGGGTATTTSTSSTPTTLSLTYVTTRQMATGTHRPEILVSSSKDIFLVVVEPQGTPGVGQVKHRAYRYDSNWNQVGNAFTVTTTTDQYGEPADHRASIINDEIVVVYQSNVFKSGCTSSVAEECAENQSLMLARFKFDGTEVLRVPIVANATSGENFPDHAHVWNSDRLYVTTGTKSSKLKIREVNLSGTILATHEYSTSTEGIPEEIGNSLMFHNGQLVLISGQSSSKTGSLSLTKMDSALGISSTSWTTSTAVEEAFTTGNNQYKNFVLVGNISRASWSADLDSNPYSPYLKVLDGNYTLLSNTKMGDTGYAHVHPTLAILDDRLFFAWSKKTTSGTLTTPQVNIEEYTLKAM